jgi:tetratricopeptide (TPR) repeat protein
LVDGVYGDEVSGSLRAARQGDAIFEAMGQSVGWPFGPYYLGFAATYAGDLGLAERELRKGAERLIAAGNGTMGSMAMSNLARVHLLAGDVAAANQILDSLPRSRHVLARAFSELIRAELHLHSGRIDAAEQQALLAAETATVIRTIEPWTLGLRARVELARGKAAAARDFADQALASGNRHGVESIVRSAILLTRAESLAALGERDEAAEAFRFARDRIRRIAASFDDPELARSFTTNLPANARTLALAAEWSGEEPAQA